MPTSIPNAVSGCIIPGRALIAATGANALDLLQRLVTADLKALTDADGAQYALLLTPQGRYRFDFFVIRQAGQLYLDAPAGQVADLIVTLAKYRLRTDAAFTLMPAATVLLEPLAAPCCLSYTDQRHEALGWRNWYEDAGPPITPHGNAFDYDARRIKLGIVEPSEDLPDNALPLDYGLDKLGCISFDKGCYLGQELTARTHNRDLAKYEVITVRDNDVLNGTVLAQANDLKLVQVRRDGK